MTSIPVRVGLQQRVMPVYRARFFDALARACPEGLSVFAGQPRRDEAIEARASLEAAQFQAAENLHLLRGRFYMLWQRGLLDWLERWQPGVLIAEANPRYLSTPAALRWMHTRRRPVIGWGLGAPPLHGAFAGLRAGSRARFLSGFDAFITYSQQGAAQYRAAGVPAERIFIAANASAGRPTHTLPARPPALTPAQATLLFVGRLQERKRIDLLLRACAVLPEGRRPHLWIVGEGPARGDLVDLAEKIYPQAEFIGPRHGAGLAPFFRAADLFVLPGTGGLAVQEAMSFGLPVMVAEADGTQTDLVRPSNGWLLPPGDQDALTRLLAAALDDIPALRRMGAESYRITLEEINLEAMVEVFVKAVNSVL